MTRKPLERRLVARGRRNGGAGAKVGGMHPDDLARVQGEQPRRPQRVGKVMATRLQLGRQAAIADQHRFVRQSQTHVVTVG